jgi:hypothetical protein
MSISEDRWFEIWFTDGEDIVPTYLLLVSPDKERPGGVVVNDPQMNYATIYRGQNYEDTRLWLEEDEYSLVKGRVFPDDGWPLETKNPRIISR